MGRIVSRIVWVVAWLTPTPVSAQESVPQLEGPWWLQALFFVASLPYTLYHVFIEGQRLHLLPAPLLVIGLCLWSFREWRRQGYWTPRIVHVMAVLGLLTIIAINVDWVLAGGEMWLQRYVVIAIFGAFPYLVYLLFLGPRLIGRRRVEEPTWVGASPGRASAGGSMERRGLDTSRVVIGGSMLLGMGVIALLVAARGFGPSSALRPELGGLSEPGSIVASARGVTTGDPEARITIMEFGDYQCPGCGTFALRIKPRLDSAFVQTGRARFVYFDLPLVSVHPNSFQASRAAHCAEDQEGFWAYHDQLYTHQDEWSSLSAPDGAFEGYAASVGLDPAAFRTCLDSDRHTDVVEANRQLARSLGIRSTPRVVVRLEDGETREMLRNSFGSIAATVEEMMGEVGGGS